MGQRADRAHTLFAQNAAGEAPRCVAPEAQHPLEQRLIGDVLAKNRIVLWVAGNDGAVAVDHRDHGIVVHRDGRDKVLEMARFDAAAGDADGLAIAAHDRAREHRHPFARHPADDHVRRWLARGEFAEISLVRDIHVGHRPHLRRIDQPALGVEKTDATDMRQHRKPGAQHFVRAQQGHLSFELVGGIDFAGLHIADDVVVDTLELAELLVEMSRQQQRAVVQLALGDLEGALAELKHEVAGAERDRHDERCGAQDQPLDRPKSRGEHRARPERPPALRDHAVR
jgi:hypothetical protein